MNKDILVRAFHIAEEANECGLVTPYGVIALYEELERVHVAEYEAGRLDGHAEGFSIGYDSGFERGAFAESMRDAGKPAEVFYVDGEGDVADALAQVEIATLGWYEIGESDPLYIAATSLDDGIKTLPRGDGA